jgi:hypothetical protein
MRAARNWWSSWFESGLAMKQVLSLRGLKGRGNPSVIASEAWQSIPVHHRHMDRFVPRDDD